MSENGNGGQQAAGGEQAGQQGSQQQASGADTYPANTPVAEMTAEQQAAYWKSHARKHEDKVKAFGGLTPEQLQALRDKAGQYDTLAAASQTDQERAVAEARQQAAAEERAKVTGRLVAAEFRAAAAGRLSGEQITTLIEDLDLSKYVNDKGDVDLDRVQRKVTAFAPTTDGSADRGGRGRTPDLGQGNRGGGKPSAFEQGRAEAQRRFAKASS